MQHKDASTLTHGCDAISKNLRYFLVPMSWLFKFDPNPPHKPKPLTLFVVLSNGMVPLCIILVDILIHTVLVHADSIGDEHRAVASSAFIGRLSKIFSVCRILYFGTLLLTLVQHGSMSNVFASKNNFVSRREQINFARICFTIFFIKVVANYVSYSALVATYYYRSGVGSTWWDFVAFISTILIFLTTLGQNSIMIYTCYLGSVLGKHVENFSKIYVDTMFDQFMKTIETEEAKGRSSIQKELSEFRDDKNKNGGLTDGEGDHESEHRGLLYRFFSCSYIVAAWHYITFSIRWIYRLIIGVCKRLNMRKYPELPEMKMTKLSSTQNIQISETMRSANSHLIRIRLRRTQVMLSELRDLVCDINKTTSPIVLVYLAYETMLIVLITTASIQAKIYRSVDIRIMPTISTIIGLLISVIYICICLDETTKQLKLMINKLFDFIIMNHRVQTTGKRGFGSLAKQHQVEESEVCVIPGSESGAINETWAQFQYTRKLANTIQFTMGGILPVTRRLALSILGHILSAVFISIEIMSIVDTSGSPDGDHNHHHHESNSLMVNETSTMMQQQNFARHNNLGHNRVHVAG